MYLELKRRTGGRVSLKQKWWLERLQEQGYKATVVCGFYDAKETIENYLNMQ